MILLENSLPHCLFCIVNTLTSSMKFSHCSTPKNNGCLNFMCLEQYYKSSAADKASSLWQRIQTLFPQPKACFPNPSLKYHNKNVYRSIIFGIKIANIKCIILAILKISSILDQYYKVYHVSSASISDMIYVTYIGNG